MIHAINNEFLNADADIDLVKMGNYLVRRGWNNGYLEMLMSGASLLILDALQKIAKHKEDKS